MGFLAAGPYSKLFKACCLAHIILKRAAPVTDLRPIIAGHLHPANVKSQKNTIQRYFFTGLETNKSKPKFPNKELELSSSFNKLEINGEKR